MKRLPAKDLSYETFKCYGSYQNLYDIEPMRRSPPGPSGFYPDLLSINFSTTTLPAVCIARVEKRPTIIPGLEYHNYTAEGLLPLDGDCLIFVGKACKEFDLDSLEAFRVPRGVFVKFNPGVIHGTQFPVGSDCVSILILLPEHTYANDTVRKPLGSGEEIEITF